MFVDTVAVTTANDCPVLSIMSMSHQYSDSLRTSSDLDVNANCLGRESRPRKSRHALEHLVAVGVIKHQLIIAQGHLVREILQVRRSRSSSWVDRFDFTRGYDTAT